MPCQWLKLLCVLYVYIMCRFSLPKSFQTLPLTVVGADDCLDLLIRGLVEDQLSQWRHFRSMGRCPFLLLSLVRTLPLLLLLLLLVLQQAHGAPSPDAPSYQNCGLPESNQTRAFNDFENALIQVSSNNPTTQLITIVDKKLQKHSRLPVRFFPDRLLQQLHPRYEAISSFFQTPRSGVR